MIEEESRKSQGRVEEGSRKGRGRVKEESRKSRGRVEEGSRKGRGRVEEGSRKSRGYTIHDEKPVHVKNDSPWKFAMLKRLWHYWCKGFASNKCDYTPTQPRTDHAHMCFKAIATSLKGKHKKK